MGADRVFGAKLMEPKIEQARPSPPAQAYRTDYRAYRGKGFMLRSILNVLYGLEGGS